jgi:hypothetical protein
MMSMVNGTACIISAKCEQEYADRIDWRCLSPTMKWRLLKGLRQRMVSKSDSIQGNCGVGYVDKKTALAFVDRSCHSSGFLLLV